MAARHVTCESVLMMRASHMVVYGGLSGTNEASLPVWLTWMIGIVSRDAAADFGEDRVGAAGWPHMGSWRH